MGRLISTCCLVAIAMVALHLEPIFGFRFSSSELKDLFERHKIELGMDLDKQKCPTSKDLDIQLILDSSKSITESDWLNILNYLKSDFVDSVFTAKDSQLAVTRYGTTVELLQELAPNVEAKWFDDRKYDYLSMGYTHTAEAMIKSFESFDRKARWNDNNVIKVLIVITDGKSNDPVLTLTKAANMWKERGVKTYALGLGTEIDIDELKQISEFHAVKVDNLEKLKKEIKKHLIPSVCKPQCPMSKHMDIQLILDSSKSITKSDWLYILNYLKSDFIDGIFTSKDSQLAITRYGTTVELLQELTPNVEAKWFEDKKYHYLDMGYTHTAEAMIKSFESFNRKARWNDGNVIKAVIVITDGKSNDPVLTLTAAANKWKERGVITYALGLGTEVDIDELKQISEFHAVKVNNLEKLKKEIMENTIANVCKPTPTQPSPAQPSPDQHGCPASKHVDIQMILDSSNSITESDWLNILNYLKSFVDSIFTVKDSQLAVTRYGTTVELLQELAPNVEAKWFDNKKYNFLNMGYTHTAEAMIKSFKSFDRKARWNDGNVFKAVIIITDGRSNDPVLFLTDAAKKWKDRGVKTYALGVGTTIDIDELKEISDSYAVKVDNLEKLKKEIMENLIPNICEEALDAVAFGN